uniref:Major facilitator superfamily (MFS) profile domain-containing protein n=1 Tax=Setaria digitata TaxID=48799 RepID=A0A915PXC4_9BILA
MDFDTLLIEVGDFGPFQITLFFVICLPASLPSAFSAFNQPFVVGQPAHRCRLPEGRDDLTPLSDYATEDDMSCRQYNATEVDLFRNLGINISNKKEYLKNLSLISCQLGWIYDNSVYIDTLVTEYDLVCDRKYWVDLTSMAFYIGSFIGNVLFGYIADKFGRRISFFIILGILVVCGTLNSFAWNIYSFIVLRFLTGLAFPALFQLPFIISMEFMGKSGRIFSSILLDVFFAAAMVLLGILAMILRRWRQLIFFSNAPFIILFVYYFIVPESPRWLVSVGRYTEAKNIIKRLAKINGRSEVDVDELMIKFIRNTYNMVAHSNKHNLTDLFRTPNLRKKTILITYIWFVNAVVYNCLTYNISNLPVNDFLSFIINGAVELPAYFIVWPLLGTIGRRWSLAGPMILAGLACISTVLSPVTREHPLFIAIMAYVSKFGIAGSFAVIYLFSGEIYPTVVRAIGMGMSSMVAGSGLILAPYVVRLGDYLRILPLVIMGLLSVTAGIASFFLPETMGKPIPQTLEEAELFGKSQQFKFFPKQDEAASCLYTRLIPFRAKKQAEVSLTEMKSKKTGSSRELFGFLMMDENSKEVLV